MSEWIDIDEKLPKRRQTILCYCTEESVISAKYQIATYICNEIRTMFNENITRNVSHWMELPEPPK